MSLKSSISDYFKLDELKENLLNLVEAKFELKKLEIQEKLEALIAKVLVKLFMAVFLIIVFFFLNILMAVGLNYLTNTVWVGYVILGGIYFVLWLIFSTQTAKVEAVIKRKIGETLDESGI
ncbi:MAG TPA: phage holin family protein [Leadbetterella sp.]|nr:phage holin family protein [Leadbetterella sp.]